MLSAAKHLGRALEPPRSFAHAQDDRWGARGFTLIELLVALVVLVVGVYGMLRIFPPGYTAIEAGQQQTTAAQLADAEIARWRLDPEALPDAVIATDYNGRAISATLINSGDNLGQVLVFARETALMASPTDYTTFVPKQAQFATLAKPLVYNPTDLTPSQLDAAQGFVEQQGEKRPATLHPGWQPNSLYLPRTIVGERIDIRSLPQTAAAGVPFYLLSHAPLDVLRWELGTGAVPATRMPVFCDIYDARPWRQVPYPAVLRAREFGYSAETKQLYFGPSVNPPTTKREFKVDYTDLTTRQRVLGATVIITSGAGPGTLPAPAGAVPDPNSLQVYERMLALSDSEYQAVLQNPLLWPRNAYHVDASTTVSGRIEFSPLLQTNPLPTDIMVAKADYRVADWQVLIFDVEVPPNGMVELPVRNIKSAGYTNPPRHPKPREVARGIRRFYSATGVQTDAAGSDIRQVNWTAWVNDARSWAYVVAVDRQSGDILTDNEALDWPPNPWMRRSRFKVDYREGLLYFNYDPGKVYGFNVAVDTPNRSGRTYRVFCRAENDWAVQLSLASRQYARASNNLPGGPPSGVTPPGTLLTYAWLREADKRKQLFFPLNDAGQAVAIDYYYHDATADIDIFVSNEVHEIGGPNVLILGQWVCPLREPLRHEPNDWGPTAVRGLSVRARTTWVTPGRSTTLQELVMGMLPAPLGRPARASLQEAWHQVMVTTYLTRAPI